MVITKHCCWVECKTGSRYPQKWPKSLQELEASGMKVFIPVSKTNARHSKVQALVPGLFTGFLYFKILPGICVFVLSTGQEKGIQWPNSLICESYSTTNKSSVCSREKGCKIKSGANNKEAEASRGKLCW